MVWKHKVTGTVEDLHHYHGYMLQVIYETEKNKLNISIR